eukprot:2348378-Pyramimonas_sp.AAC.1
MSTTIANPWNLFFRWGAHPFCEENSSGPAICHMASFAQGEGDSSSLDARDSGSFPLTGGAKSQRTG